MDLRTGIIETARAIGANPLDLATVISYETGGTFDPLQPGPTTQWGQHRGLIQFGEPQARQHGVDWDNPLQSQLGPDGAVASYFRSSGYQPGMGLLDLYSTVNAGAPGLYNRSDANNGGAPGTVRDKVENQMSGHRQRAASLLGGDFAEGFDIASDVRAALGFGPRMSASGGDRVGILGMAGGQQPQQASSKTWLGMDRDRQDRLALALGGMSMHPNQALMGAVQDRIDDRRGERRAQQERSRTLEYLQGLVNEGVLPPQALAMAEVDPSGALQMARTAMTAGNDPNVQSSQMLPDLSGTVMTMRDGTLRVVTAGGETLSGQAAMDFVQRAQGAYTEQQRAIYGARTAGALESQIELSGEAERAKQEGKMAPTTAKEFFDQARLVESTIGNIDTAIRAIDAGANSGIIYRMLPAMDLETATLKNAMNELGLNVIGSVTFGALSQAELTLALETAVPQNLGPEELRVWLSRKREAQARAHVALMEAALHFANGGTQAQYYERIGYRGAPDAPGAADSNAGPAQGPGLTDDDLRYLGVD